MARFLLWSSLRGALGFALSLGTASPAPVYTVKNLGVLPGDSYSYGNAINNSGQVAGTSSDGVRDKAFRYTDGVGMQDLGGSSAADINNSGQVVGTVPTRATSPFRYSDDTGMQILPAFGGASGINDSGQVAGTISSPFGPDNASAFRYTDGVGMEILGHLPVTVGNGFSVGYAINNSGQVAGASITGRPGAPANHAFRYTDEVGMQDLGVLPGGSYSEGYAINNSGQVAGRSSTGRPGANHAFRYTDGVGMQDLGVLPGGSYSEGYGINDAGHVVGSMSDPRLGELRAFLYTDPGGMVDLNTLIPSNSGWLLYEARDINNRGQITGTGLFNGEQRAFLLTPIPEPGSVGLLVAGLLVFAGLAHQRPRGRP